MKPRGGIIAKQLGEPVVEAEIIGEGIGAWEIGKVEGLSRRSRGRCRHYACRFPFVRGEDVIDTRRSLRVGTWRAGSVVVRGNCGQLLELGRGGDLDRVG